MSLTTGTRLGSYDVIGTLGSGGMGDVYRAHDTKLNRDVALKVLPAALASDPERVGRFRREAQLLAALNHPNIAQIYDAGSETPVGSPGGPRVFLAMELVPGRTLAETIDADGALAPETAVHIATQIAEALEAAHEQGIIHRDLKPANIKQRDDDVVKVLDFGLARAMDFSTASGSGAAETMSSPTMLSPAMTQHGMILGTAGYMSPEQAKGRLADKRADIWAFGVVLYEMLTGKRLFAGETITEVIAAVIKDAPSLDALPATVPPALRHLIGRCLEREPKLRLRDIGEARIMLRTALDPANPWNRVTPSASGVSSVPARSTGIARGLFALGALALAGVAAYVAWQAKPGAVSVPVRRFDLPAVMAGADPVLSPDGSRIAYLKTGHLYLHTLTTGATTDLGTVPPATEIVFWSPDSQSIGYGAESTLRTQPITGGVPFTVCKIPASGRVMDAVWQQDGTITFAVWRDHAYRVVATGGTPTVRVPVDAATEVDFHRIAQLPDGRLILTTHVRGEDGFRADLVDGDKRTPLSTDLDIAVGGSAPNLLVFTRTRMNAGIWVAPFDGKSLDLAKATLIEPRAQGFYVAADGTMVANIPARERRELAWVARSGAITPVPGSAFETAGPHIALAPDGNRAVIAVRTADGKDEFVVRDLTTGADTRLPMPRASTGIATGAEVTWTPAGRLLYAAGGVETVQIYDWPADGSANGRPLVSGVVARMLRDGKNLLFIQDVRSHMRLFRAPMPSDGAAGKPEPMFPGENEPRIRHFDLSREEHLLAYDVSDPATEQGNVFIATFPDLRERRQVTSTGGVIPQFSPDGQELFYTSGTRTADGSTLGMVQVVSIKRDPLAVSAPTVLFKSGEGAAAGDRALVLTGFAPAPGARLLMARQVPSAPADEARTVLIQNWLGAIKK